MDSSRVTFGLASKGGLQTGQKGKKYGLVAAPRSLPAGTSVFGAAALEEETAEEQLRRDAIAKQSRADVQQLHAAALTEDPTAFDYDGVFDAMQQQRADVSNAAKARDNKPRYIGSIIEAAKLRTIENDRVYERKLLKERDADAELYEDKEKFVTSAYRAKLAERAAHDAKLREEAELDARQDVTKRRDLSDFHRNLLFGEPSAPPAPSAAPGASASQPAAGLHADAARPDVSRAPAPQPSQPPAPHADAAASPGGDRAASGGAGGRAGGSELPAQLQPAGLRPASTARPEEALAGAATAAPPAHEPAPARVPKLPRDAPAGERGASEEGDAAAAAAKVARRNDDDAVTSARERYLQRKAAQQLQPQ